MSGGYSKWRTLLARLLRICALAAVSTYVILCGYVAAIQRRLLYFPTHHTPASLLERWERGGQLIGFKREVSGAKTAWLYLHGNSGQASERSAVLRKVGTASSYYIVEYPGYGGRAGSPSEDALNSAAREAYLELVASGRYERIGVVGESLGSGPASFLGTVDPQPAKIALIVPYDEIVAVAGERYPWLPVRFLMRDQWKNSEALRGYRGEVVIFAASEDEVIPPHHARRLHERVPGSRLVIFRGGHNDWPESGDVKIGF
ncbi:MAG: alpha/beta hydrolase [Opitutaceae bacterium]|nr:alpha/beta hydrolase [Opitutaceae bacterium]